jgi:membrane protein DedA with SNARE-associated domain
VVEPILHWVSLHGYLGIFSLLMLGIVGVPIPDETLLVFTGYLSYKGDLHILPAEAAAFMGSVYGITLSYGIGRIGGLFVLKKYGYLIHVDDHKMKVVGDWLERRGKWGLVLGYYIPGIRHLAAVVAGASKLGYSTFALFAYSGALIWTTTFISIGYLSGEGWAKTSGTVREFAVALLVVLIIASVVGFVLFRHRKKLPR